MTYDLNQYVSVLNNWEMNVQNTACGAFPDGLQLMSVNQVVKTHEEENDFNFPKTCKITNRPEHAHHLSHSLE